MVNCHDCVHIQFHSDYSTTESKEWNDSWNSSLKEDEGIYRSYSWLYFSPVFAKDYRKKRRKKKMKMRNNWNWPKTKSMSPTLVSFGIIHIT